MNEGSIEHSVPTEPSESFDVSREAAKITLARVNTFDDLNVKTEAAGERKFHEQTRKLWDQFAVSGIVKVEENGVRTIQNKTDLDGRSTLGIMRLAKLNTEDTIYVAPGDSIEGRINLDTGGRDGMVVEDSGETAFFDHHGPESKNDSSATQIAYETMTKLGLIKKEPWLDKLVTFITQMDNKTFPDAENYYLDSYRTMMGLSYRVDFKHLVDFFKAGRNPTELLSPHDIRQMGLRSVSEGQKETIQESEDKLKKMEHDGLIIDSPRYGLIAVDIGKRIPGGVDAVKAYGCDGYLLWSPMTNSFFLSSTTPLERELPQGKRVRETMWIKPRTDETPLTTTLSEVLAVLTDNKLEPQGELKKYLDQEKKPHADVTTM